MDCETCLRRNWCSWTPDVCSEKLAEEAIRKAEQKRQNRVDREVYNYHRGNSLRYLKKTMWKK